MTRARATGPRRRLGREERRAQLVQLGLDLLRDRPFDQLLIDQVIRGAGISKGLLFHYFPSKRDYQLAVVGAAAQELLAAIEPDGSLDLLAQLRAGIASYLDYIEQNRASYTAIVRGAGSDGALLALFDDTREAVARLVIGRLVDEPDPMLRLAVRAWIASVEEAAFLWLEERPCTRDELVDLLHRSALVQLPLVGALVESPASAPAAS